MDDDITDLRTHDSILNFLLALGAWGGGYCRPDKTSDNRKSLLRKSVVLYLIMLASILVLRGWNGSRLYPLCMIQVFIFYHILNTNYKFMITVYIYIYLYINVCIGTYIFVYFVFSYLVNDHFLT